MDLENLGRQFLEAKKDEADARARRIEIEKQIIDRIGLEDEGRRALGNDVVTVATVQKISRTVDVDEWFKVSGAFSSDLYPVKLKPHLDLKIWRQLKDEHPDLAKLAARSITEKPAKPSVEVRFSGEGENV